MISVHLDIQGTSKILRRIAAVKDATTLHPYSQRIIARAALRGIRDRTAKGLDVSEKPFEAYSRRHQQKRRAKGLSDKLVNLRFSGTMLGDARAVRRGNQPAVRFNSAWAGYLANLHQQGRGNLPTREFLGFKRGTSSYAAVQKTAREVLRDQVRRALSKRV